MIDPTTLAYTYDEERLGFGTPEPLAAPAANRGQQACAALVALGFLAGAVQLIRGGAYGWPGFLLAFGPVVVGLLGYFHFGYRDTAPGIQNDGSRFSSTKNRGLIGWGLGVFATGFYVVLYWWPEQLDAAIRLTDPLAMALAKQPADQWFLYGLLYTLAVLLYGVRMLYRDRHNRYQQVRTASVMFWQVGFSFLIPQILKALHEPEYYFTYFWPLKPDYLYPWHITSLLESPGRLGVFMVFWGIVMTFVATPILTYFFGKRWYCSWVCGCGGLAETIGDPFRQLSSKKVVAWKLERALIYSVLVVVTVGTIVIWTDVRTQGQIFGSWSGPVAKWYGFYIGSLWAGIIGVGFYPLLGSRVWCRFGCPMAAVLGVFQRFFSRFRITTNGDQCMSCGNCSTFCEMGIDVRAYAQEGLNIVRSSCVGCGVCSAVCPRGVLKLENGATWSDRYPGSDRPLDALLEAIRAAQVYRGEG